MTAWIQSSLFKKEEAVTDVPEEIPGVMMPPVVERVQVMQAGATVRRIDGDHSVIAFITPLGRSYEFMLDEDGKRGLIKKLTGGVELPKMVQL